MEDLNIPEMGEENASRVNDKTERSFWLAAEQIGFKISREYIRYMKGWPIRLAFETLVNKLSPYAKEKEIRQKVEEFYRIFRSFLERQYQLR
jgi:hypothetical protein